MKKLLQLGLILVGSVTLSFTMANATCGSGKADETKRVPPKTMKCGSGKAMMERGKCDSDRPMMERGKCDSDRPDRTGRCGTDKNKTKKETNTTKPAPTKTAPAKGKCGIGKCG